MGWKTSMLVINSDKNVTQEKILDTLGFNQYEEIEDQFLDSIINPDEGLLYIGNYNGNIIVTHQDLPMEFLSPYVSPWEKKLSTLFPDTEIASFVLMSTVNLWGYSLTKNGIKLRARAGCAEGDFQLDEGEILEEEKLLFSNSSINENGERIFTLDGNEYDPDQVGENFVFDISKRFFGESLDRGDTLLFETKFKGFRLSTSQNSASLTGETYTPTHKILATQQVINGSEINVLHKMDGIWLLISKDEFSTDTSPDTDGLRPIHEDLIYKRIPNLKGKLDQPDNTTINIDYKTGEININKQHKHIGIPTHDAKATRQADAGFSFLHYLNTTKSRLKKPAIITLVLFLSGYFLGWLLYIPMVLYAAFQILTIFKTRDMYYSGALCPAIVIDASTSKIAALTDLSLGGGSYPIIRVRKYPLPEKYKKNGQKIPVAGGYQNTEDYNHWNFYEPNPLPSGIKDDSFIQQKIEQIPTQEWVDLNSEIKKFNGIPKEGYYPINIDKSNWKDMDLTKIEWMQFGEEK